MYHDKYLRYKCAQATESRVVLCRVLQGKSKATRAKAKKQRQRQGTVNSCSSLGNYVCMYVCMYVHSYTVGRY